MKREAPFTNLPRNIRRLFASFGVAVWHESGDKIPTFTTDIPTTSAVLQITFCMRLIVQPLVNPSSFLVRLCIIPRRYVLRKTNTAIKPNNQSVHFTAPSAATRTGNITTELMDSNPVPRSSRPPKLPTAPSPLCHYTSTWPAPDAGCETFTFMV